MYFFSHENLYRAVSKGALVREFVECNPGQGDLLEEFVDDLKTMKLSVDSNYFKVMDYVVGQWGEHGLETFKKECEREGVEYHPRPSKTFFYNHPNGILFKITLDEDDVIDQIFMQGRHDLWKTLRADQARAKVILNHADYVARGESFGHYSRIFI